FPLGNSSGGICLLVWGCAISSVFGRRKSTEIDRTEAAAKTRHAASPRRVFYFGSTGNCVEKVCVFFHRDAVNNRTIP
ncbi:MAG: hypothetical protein LBD35_05320, partial [Prevotellaceae bacterium]|nr:hypothetical protein [Prevotellaceae bacterium]